MFQSARIKLTCWYTLLIMFVALLISIPFYIQTVTIIDRQQERFEQRFAKELGRPAEHRPNHPQPLDADEAKHEALMVLLLINGVVLIAVAGAAYILSGKTLKPIEVAHEEQKRFVSDAAHELKTPIAALKISHEVNLMDKKLNRYAKAILRENLKDVVSLENLTNSLLKLARIDGNSLLQSPIKVSKFVKKAVARIQPIAKKKEIVIKTQGLKNQTKILGDEDVLADLILIFLDNAIKYSPKKSTITVLISSKAKRVTVSIQDNGVGIDESDIDHIFDRFYRVSKSRSKNSADGYGLGLSVAQKIASEHNATVSVESIQSKGTTFSIAFPSIF